MVGLQKTLEYVMRVHSSNNSSKTVQRAVYDFFKNIQTAYMSNSGTIDYERLATEFTKDTSSIGNLLLKDSTPTNLVGRAKVYDNIGFFDWSYLRSQVEDSTDQDPDFALRRSDLHLFDQKKDEFSDILSRGIP